MANYIKSFNFRNGVQVDNDNFIVNAAGRVGIGTTVPDKILDVRGNAKVVGHITATDASVSGIVTVGSITINGNTGTISATNFSGAGGDFGNAPVVAISTIGFIAGPTGLTTTNNLGIGTNSTGFQLQVGGNPSSSIGFGVTDGNVTASGNLKVSGITTLGITTTTTLFSNNLRSDKVTTRKVIVGANIVAEAGIVTSLLFDGNLTGNVTGNVTGNLNSTGVSTVGTLKVGTGITASGGIITATTFDGNITGNVTGNLNSTGVSTVGTLKVGTGITASGGIITATTFDGNVATAISFANARNFSVTGDLEASSVSFDGTANVSLASTLSNSFSANTSGIITAATIVGSAGSFSSIGIHTSAPTTDLQIRKSSGEAILEVISDTGSASISIGKNTGAGTSSASFNYGSTSGFGNFSTPKSLDIINRDTGNINYFLSNTALTDSGFIWHRGSANQLMTLTKGGNLGIGITNPTHKLHVQGISTFTGPAHFDGNLTVDSNLSITGSLSVRDITSSIDINGIVTATKFVGDGSGLTNLIGTGSGVEIRNDGSPVGTASTIDFIGTDVTATISGGVASVEITTSGGGSSGVTVKNSGSTVGIATNIDFGSNLSVSAVSAGIVTITASGGGTSDIASYAHNAGVSTVAGIATYTSEWTLGNNGTSHYTFTGPGLTGAEDDPEIYLIRGQQYKFTNNMNAHPFKIQSTPNGSNPADSGTVYNDGITNNLVSNGTLTWNVQFDTPSILYYQCTSHTNMGGIIRILDAVTTDSSVTDVITISSSTDVLSAVDPGADRLVFWDESNNKLSYLTVGANLTLNDDIISATSGDVVVNDTTPQLGGNLDLNSKDITGTGNVNITGVITATSFSGNLTGNVNSTGVSTVGTLKVGTGITASGGIITATTFDGNLTGNVNSTGVSTVGTLKVGTGITASGGIITATTFDGSLKGLPQNAQTSAYVLVASDAGKHVAISTGGVTLNTGIFEVGDTVTVFNDSAYTQMINAASGVTVRRVSIGDLGSRGLNQYGLATIMCIRNNEYVISGAGLT